VTTLPLRTGARDERPARGRLQTDLYGQLRSAMLSGQLRAGTRLPSTRQLAAERRVSRTTVLAVYEQLRAEGFVDARAGAGTFVAAELPDATLLGVTGPAASAPRARGLPRTPAAAGRLPPLRSLTDARSPCRPFQIGVPSLDAFPARAWSAAVARASRRVALDHTGGGAGLRALRVEIAARLAAIRGVRCDADQVFVVGGAQGGVRLAAELLVGAGDVALVEDPCYVGMRAAYALAGAQVVSAPVDAAGMRIADYAGPPPAVVSVTPSCQFPTGATMSVARRLELLGAARRWRSFVVEDDYDSEYRYAGRPVAALQGLDQDGRVLYVGTFSKVMFPSLRIGYVIVPDALVDTFSRGRLVAGVAPSLLLQAALADFAGSGQLDRHVRRMRAVYAEREALLAEELADLLDGEGEVQRPGAGLHLVLHLAHGSDTEAAAAAEAVGVRSRPLSIYAGVPATARNGLLLGFAAFRPAQLRLAARALVRALRASANGRKG
jgi:GntR family transcriptional regulator/MocR family aminotransferase